MFMKENGLIRKLTLISNLVTSQTGKKIITIHTLSNILISHEVKAMRQ